MHFQLFKPILLPYNCQNNQIVKAIYAAIIPFYFYLPECKLSNYNNTLSLNLCVLSIYYSLHIFICKFFFSLFICFCIFASESVHFTHCPNGISAIYSFFSTNKKSLKNKIESFFYLFI